MLYLFSVSGIVIVTDETNHCGVICKLDDSVGIMHRSEAACEERVEERTQYIPLWYTSVDCDGQSKCSLTSHAVVHQSETPYPVTGRNTSAQVVKFSVTFSYITWCG